jgi:hypothetical protein
VKLSFSRQKEEGNMNTLTVHFIFSAFTLFNAVSGNTFYPKFVKNASLNNRPFSGEIVFDLEITRSMIDCARLCAKNCACVSFTLYEGVKCRGHSVALTTASSSAASFGAATFISGE